MSIHENDERPIWTRGIEGQVALVTGAGRGLGRACALTLSAARVMMRRGSGSIVNMSSQMGHVGSPRRTVYRGLKRSFRWRTLRISPPPFG